jgi:bla regulator protein BlaR1
MRDFLMILLEHSVSMSVLVVALMALTPLLSKRYAAKWLYYAWLVIVTGLIIPFRFHITIPILWMDAVPFTVQQNIPVSAGDLANAATKINTVNQEATTIPWIKIIGILWFMGAIVFLIYNGLRHARFLKMVRRWSEQTDNPQMLGVLEHIKTDMGIAKTVKLQICSCVSSPMMIGFLNPVILLPRPDFSTDELPYIFCHELVHFKRKDLWYKSLVVLATAIHWFNPMVYLMARVIASQCEISCDAEVISKSDIGTRQQYSETIIGVIKNQSRMKTAFSTNFYGAKKGMKKRIFAIMDMKKKKAGVAVICLILIGTIGTSMAFAVNKNMASGSYSTNTTISAEEQAKINQQDREELAKKYAVYEQYGLTYDKDTDNLYYDGKLVRCFSDMLDADGSYNVFTCSNGVVNLKAVRNADYELTGISPVSKEDSSSDEESGETGNTVNSSTFEYFEGDPNYKEILSEYDQYGISFDKDGEMLFNDEPVRYFWDGVDLVDNTASVRYE